MPLLYSLRPSSGSPVTNKKLKFSPPTRDSKKRLQLITVANLLIFKDDLFI